MALGQQFMGLANAGLPVKDKKEFATERITLCFVYLRNQLAYSSSFEFLNFGRGPNKSDRNGFAVYLFE